MEIDEKQKQIHDKRPNIDDEQKQIHDKRPKIDHDEDEEDGDEDDDDDDEEQYQRFAKIMDQGDNEPYDYTACIRRLVMTDDCDASNHPFVFPGDKINMKDLLFTERRKHLINKDGDKVGPESLSGKTIVLYIVPLNFPVDDEKSTTLDILDAYYNLRKKEDTVFVFVGVNIVYAPPDEWTWNEPPPLLGLEEQKANFDRIFSFLPFPTIPFEDQAGRQRVAVEFKLHHVTPRWICFLPYWSIIDQQGTVVASMSDIGYEHLFCRFAGEELRPFTRKNIQRVICQRAKPREMLSNLDQLLESFNRDFLLSSKGEKVHVSSLKDKIVGLYVCDDEPNARNMNLIRGVCKEAADREIRDFQIVQLCIRVPNEVYNHSRCSSPPKSVSEQETIDWLKLPFEDPRCKKLLRILSHVLGPEEDPYDDDSLYGCLVIFQPKRDTFELSGAEILKAYGIKGHPFTRESLLKAEMENVRETMKLSLLFPPGSRGLKMWSGSEFIPIDNDRLSGKKVLVFYAFEYVIERCGKYISMLRKKYRDGEGFEVVFVSNSMSESCTNWLLYPNSVDLRYELESKLFKGAMSQGRSGGISSGVAAFGDDGELIAKFYRLDDWSENDEGVEEFPFVSRRLEDAVREDVCNACMLDRFSSRLD